MLQLLPYAEDNLQLALTDLISLTDAQLPGGALALRPLNQTHILQLIESDQSTWPAIQVTRCDGGFIVIDGNHRREAALRKQSPLILADCKAYADERAVIDAAFRANLTHGLKANLTTRGDYAYWLHVTFPKFPQEKIAERAGLTQGAVSKAIARRERALHGQEPATDTTKLMHRSFRRLAREAQNLLEHTTSGEELSSSLARSLKESERGTLIQLARLLESLA